MVYYLYVLFFERTDVLNIPVINVGDTLVLKKKHPCGTNEFDVLRVGSDIRIRCKNCGRDLTIPRITLEKSIKSVISKGN